MIYITPNIKQRFPAVFKTARKDRMRVVWLEDDLVYVARTAKGHGQYLEKFNVTPDGRVSIHCRSIFGPSCDGMRFKGLCAHAAKVLLRGIPKGRKTKHAEAA